MSQKSLPELIASRQPNVGNVLFIGVDGHGGSGKSTLANLLSEKLNAEIIHTDDFASWENQQNWWPDVVRHVFEPISNGATTLSYPRSSWWENHHPKPVVDQKVTKIMILEGVRSLRREFRNFMSVGIFVDTPQEICLARGIERDKSTGKTIEELTTMWNEWFDAENEYFKRDDPKTYADIVIDGTKPFEF